MCGVVSALLCLYCRSGCRSSVVASALTFHPPYPPYYDFEYNPTTKDFTFVVADGVPTIPFASYTAHVVTTKQGTNVPVVLLRHPEAKFTIIFSHGNATDIGAMFLIFSMMAISLRVNIVGYDYTGYGVSNIIDSKINAADTSVNRGSDEENIPDYHSIKPSEQQTYSDIEAVYEWCVQYKLVSDPSKEIIAYGQSVGSGPSCYLASTAKIAGLVLHSPIMSGLRVITPSRSLACWDIYPNIERIANISAPAFIIHGQDDAEVSCTHGFELYDKIPEGYKTPPWWVPKRGHNDVLNGNEAEFLRRMRAYLERVAQHILNPVIEETATKGQGAMLREVALEEDDIPQTF